MSDMAKKARAAMKAKAKSLTSANSGKVDSSTWTPAKPLNADVKTGMRPVSRRAYKSGGKVVGVAALARADKKPRGKMAKEAKEFANAKVNRDLKSANEERDGIKHVGGFKEGGRTGKLSGGALARYAKKAARKGDMAARMAKGDDSGEMAKYANKRQAGVQMALAKMQNKFGESEKDSDNYKKGGRAKRDEGGKVDAIKDFLDKDDTPTPKAPPKPPSDKTPDVTPEQAERMKKFGTMKPPAYKKGGKVGKAEGGPLEGAEAMMSKARNKAGVPSSGIYGAGFERTGAGAISPAGALGKQAAKKGGKIKGRSGKAVGGQPAPVATPAPVTASAPVAAAAPVSAASPVRVAAPVAAAPVAAPVAPGRPVAAPPATVAPGRMPPNPHWDDHGANHQWHRGEHHGLYKGQRGHGPAPTPVVARKDGGKAVKHSDEAADRKLIKKMVKPSARTGKSGGGLLKDAAYDLAKDETETALKGKLDEAMGNAGARGMSNFKKGGRTARKAGGKVKGKTNINIVIATGTKPPQDGQMAGGMGGADMGAAPPPGGAPDAVPVPMPMDNNGGQQQQAPMPMPIIMPQQAPAQGAAPMPRKRGGRTVSSYKDMTAGAGSGEGRLQKTEIAAKQPKPAFQKGKNDYDGIGYPNKVTGATGGRTARKSGGRSYMSMEAGAGSGLGRLHKAHDAKKIR